MRKLCSSYLKLNSLRGLTYLGLGLLSYLKYQRKEEEALLRSSGMQIKELKINISNAN